MFEQRLYRLRKMCIRDRGCTLGEELIKPTRIYVKTVLGLLERGVRIRAVSHITGGGLYENVPRMMKEGLTARIQKGSFPVPPIFDLIAKRGNIPERDMYNTFNMGVGLVIALSLIHISPPSRGGRCPPAPSS